MTNADVMNLDTSALERSLARAEKFGCVKLSDVYLYELLGVTRSFGLHYIDKLMDDLCMKMNLKFEREPLVNGVTVYVVRRV